MPRQSGSAGHALPAATGRALPCGRPASSAARTSKSTPSKRCTPCGRPHRLAIRRVVRNAPSCRRGLKAAWGTRSSRFAGVAGSRGSGGGAGARQLLAGMAVQPSASGPDQSAAASGVPRGRRRCRAPMHGGQHLRFLGDGGCAAAIGVQPPPQPAPEMGAGEQARTIRAEGELRRRHRARQWAPQGRRQPFAAGASSSSTPSITLAPAPCRRALNAALRTNWVPLGALMRWRVPLSRISSIAWFPRQTASPAARHRGDRDPDRRLAASGCGQASARSGDRRC